MNKCRIALALVLLTLGCQLPLRAEESLEQQLLREIVNLRVDIAQQRSEIMALREELGQMHAKMDGKTYRKVASVPTAATPETYANAKATAVEEPAPAKPTGKTPKVIEPEEVVKPGAGKPYKVKSGDTLSSIARTNKVTLDALKSANPGIEPKSLKVGMVLKMP